MSTAQRRSWPVAALAILLGVVIIACAIESGIHRWSDPAWYYASMLPGSPMSWGVIILSGGILVAAGEWNPVVRRVGFWVVFLWFCFMASASSGSVWHDLAAGTREADPIDIVQWGACAYWCRVSMAGD